MSKRSTRPFLIDDTPKVFRKPNFRAPVDLNAHLALLNGEETILGVFFNDLLDKAREAAPDVDLFARAGLPPSTYRPLTQYEYRNWQRLAFAAVKVIYPDQPHGEGLRRLGQRCYESLLSTSVGRLMFALFNRDVKAIFMNGNKAWRYVQNFGDIKARDMGANQIIGHYREFPGFLETLQVGILESAILYHKASPNISIALDDLETATYRIEWS